MKGKQKGECKVKRGFGTGIFFGVFGGIAGSILSLMWFVLGILFADSMTRDVRNRVRVKEKLDEESR